MHPVRSLITVTDHIIDQNVVVAGIVPVDNGAAGRRPAGMDSAEVLRAVQFSARSG
jgi:hypothetical protein